MTAPTDLIAASADRFRHDITNHTMTVLHDDGLYRHLRFENGRNEIAHFNLITWPNGLLIRGDGPNFVFSTYSTVDSFDFFRRSAHSGINPDYWAERVAAGRVMAWSEPKFRTWVASLAKDAEPFFPGTVAAVADQIVDSDECSIEDEESARYAVAMFHHNEFQIRFPERWEQKFEDFHWSYLWACHAIVWGVSRYDGARSAVSTVGVPA